MAKKGEGITPQQRAFVTAYVANPDVKAAQRVAGYTEESGGGYKALRKPAIAAEVARLQLERISNTVLPLAVDVHIELLTNKNTPAGARVQAVKLAYDRAFGDGASDKMKEPHEMSAEEIAKALMALQREASERARPVIEGESTQVAPNPLD